MDLFAPNTVVPQSTFCMFTGWTLLRNRWTPSCVKPGQQRQDVDETIEKSMNTMEQINKTIEKSIDTIEDNEHLNLKAIKKSMKTIKTSMKPIEKSLNTMENQWTHLKSTKTIDKNNENQLTNDGKQFLDQKRVVNHWVLLVTFHKPILWFVWNRTPPLGISWKKHTSAMFGMRLDEKLLRFAAPSWQVPEGKALQAGFRCWRCRGVKKALGKKCCCVRPNYAEVLR